MIIAGEGPGMRAPGEAFHHCLVSWVSAWQTERSAQLRRPTARYRFTPLLDGDPGPSLKGSEDMKQGIHPEYKVTEVTCSCGATFTTRSTAKSGQMHADVCSACHPFYTGKQKIMDIGGRVDKFEKRYGKRVRNS
jgi:large subunit ribosomal protein L31